jgi:hypothetical protein
MWKRCGLLVITLVVLCSASIGCLRRKERFEISSDGRVTIRLEYRGNETDWRTEDAMPSRESGWDIEESKETEDDEEIRVIRATRTFAPGESLPANFVPSGSSNPDLYTAFPTSVRLEKRPDGLYVHFNRTYTPRRWAYVDYWRKKFISEDIEKLAEKRAADLTREERIKLLKAFAAVEAHKRAEFALAALRACDSPLATEYGVRSWRTILDVYQEIDVDRLLQVFESTDDAQREAEFDRESQRLMRQAHESLMASLPAVSDDDRNKIAQFGREYHRVQKAHKITEQTGAHFFEIHVQMPGRIVAHNADKIAEDGTAVWEFSGEAFRDRAHEIMMISRVGTP